MLLRGSATAAWVVQACGVRGPSILPGATAATTFANGADSIFGAIRAAVGECQRLLKTGGLELDIATAPARKRLALDLVEPPVHGEFVITLRLASGTVRGNGTAKRSDQGQHGQAAVFQIALPECCHRATGERDFRCNNF
jgi:hypothetical protein